jgi:hypothetical protein
MKIKKEHIDAIDSKAYTDDAFVGDLFKQFKTAPINSFATEYKRQENDWTTGKRMIFGDPYRRRLTPLHKHGAS